MKIKRVQKPKLNFSECIGKAAAKRGLYRKLLRKITVDDGFGSVWHFRISAMAEPGIPIFSLEVAEGFEPRTCMRRGLDVDGMLDLADFFRWAARNASADRDRAYREYARFRKRLTRTLAKRFVDVEESRNI